MKIRTITFKEAEQLAKNHLRPIVVKHADIRDRMIWGFTKEYDGWEFGISLIPPESDEVINPEEPYDDSAPSRARRWLEIQVKYDGTVKVNMLGTPSDIWP